MFSKFRLWKNDKSEKMKDELNYNNIEELLNNLPDNFKILEETIDIEIQKEFFDSAQNIQFSADSDTIAELIDQLNDSNTKLEDKKLVLQKLSMTDSVESFRAIENFRKDPPVELKDWTVLAFQQSQMIIQSSLLEEQQVFISTGLGGKLDKLRYFLIFPYASRLDIDEIQKEMLKKELSFVLEQNNGELEEIEFLYGYATAFALIPLNIFVSDMIKDILLECNQYGHYLTEDVIITNIKKFNHEEILEILKKYEQQNKSGSSGSTTI